MHHSAYMSDYSLKRFKREYYGVTVNMVISSNLKDKSIILLLANTEKSTPGNTKVASPNRHVTDNSITLRTTASQY
jgi:hypothetical protein